MTPLHPVAATGFDRAAGVYATSRPGYPGAIVDWMRDRLGIAPGRTVLELGAGTGKFTASLVRTGADILALEPIAAMLDHLVADFPEVRPLVGQAEAIPLPDESVDAVVCATAFHWFATPAVMAEIRRVLKVGGTLGLVWNLRDEAVGWVKQLSVLTNAHQGTALRERADAWRDVFPAEGFSSLEESEWAYAHHGTVEDVVVGRTLSTSFIATLPAAARAEVVAQVRDLITATPALQHNPVAFPYVTKGYDCRRIA
ncbi:class I SAM-dependent methyltransferase [Sphingomonas sp. PAMC 26621]|uniref:class I SAM-dependent methyltransferase n=1 Tax=Sphingomonas sp. PAMC 26621 TaxID=1112213 RepID=UPI000288C3BE|nr:class I SAM-dependent methyltransferase [Sphingomonas sp. PAMC 26621]